MTINIIILLKLLCCTSNSTFAPQIWRGDDGGADHITLSELRSKCSIWGAVPQHEQYNQFDGQRSLLTGFHYNFLSSPHFWHLLLNSDIWPSLSKMANFDDQKSKYEGWKKRHPLDDIDMCFLQKTGFKLIKFGLCGSIYILHPAIGGSHPVPCLSTQIAERQGTAMY